MTVYSPIKARRDAAVIVRLQLTPDETNWMVDDPPGGSGSEHGSGAHEANFQEHGESDQG
jgi:hypothetical protein